MEPKDMASFQIDKSIVEGVVQKAIHSAVVAQLSASQDVLVDKIANWITNDKFDINGNKATGYDRDERNKYTMVEVIFQQQLKEFAKASVAEWISANKTDIKKKFHEAMKKSNVADAFIGAMIANITSSYSTEVKIEFRKHER